VKKHSEPKVRKPRSRSAKVAAPTHAVPAGVTDVDNGLHLPVHELAPALEGLDETSLSRAKAHWFFGDWAALAKLDLGDLNQHPDRDRLALLVASAHQQFGNHDKTRQFTRRAMEWGCPPRIVAQVLTAGVHNTLGRASALKEDSNRTVRHFEAAVAIGTNKDTALASHARSVREMANLGLLSQAVNHLVEFRDQSKQGDIRPSHAVAHIKVLDMEVDLIRQQVQSLKKQYDQGVKSPMIGQIKAPIPAATESADNTKKYYGLNGLDEKLEAYINYDSGYFVELGANDGLSQSNTYYFEKERGWRGLLIEPILHNFLKCRSNRSPENVYSCAACVSFEYDKPHVSMIYSNLMTVPTGLESDIPDPLSHAQSGTVYLKDGETPVEMLAPAKTLSALLDDAQAPKFVDLLSLDVEGAEIEVLKGIDHDKYRFKYLLVECRDEQIVRNYLAQYGYHLIDKLSHHDLLFAMN
jgi:FkbM family methyltransferase